MHLGAGYIPFFFRAEELQPATFSDRLAEIGRLVETWPRGTDQFANQNELRILSCPVAGFHANGTRLSCHCDRSRLNRRIEPKCPY